MSEGNGRTWTAEIKKLGDDLVALTVAKAVELGDYLEEVHKIKPAASAVASQIKSIADKKPETAPA